ncbi:MAG: hypothetical protein CMN44_03930 [SAR116 cluster bacterium]|nr:hypothetical protein [SAR116 cluster bacterium]RPH10740.1 MAG: YciI family protein [Alphaproteobacteria bacterium TMED54]
MIWIIVCKDKADALPRRMAVIEEHRKYLSTNPIKTMVSGPLTDLDGETMNGSFFMVEADEISEIHKFQENDPLFHAEVWEDIIISPFNKRVDNLSN